MRLKRSRMVLESDMKNLLSQTIHATALVFVISLPAFAQENTGPSTNIAWTIKTLNLLRSGNAERGAKLNIELECATCHGKTGLSTNSTWPSLTGQRAGYVFKVLKDYQDEKLSRTDRGQLMSFIVKEMSDQDMVDLASYFASMPLPSAKPGIVQEKAKNLDTLGDPKRLIPPCSVCHGNNAAGDFPDFPALAGQSSEFLTRSLRNFRSGQRSNDVYSRMRLIAKRLTDAEIKSLANYFAAKGSK